MDERVVILGGGVSGLSLAFRLADHDVPVHVLEARGVVGGLARTERSGGHCLDVGPHSFFAEDDEALDFVLGLFPQSLDHIPRRVKFLFGDRLLDYPLTPRGVLTRMGWLSGARATLSYLRGRLAPARSSSLGAEEETVEDWARANFGEHLYRTFFKPYTEQFWKLPCRELSSRAIPTHTRMSFFNTLKSLIHRPRGERAKSLLEREALPTYYPRTGFGEIPERLAEAVVKKGGRVQLGSRATAIRDAGAESLRVAYERRSEPAEIAATRVVSTVPLNEAIPMLRPEPPSDVVVSARRLTYRALSVLGMVTERQRMLNCGYMYMLNRPYNRVSEMNEFSPHTSPKDENILAVEIPCFKDGPTWNAGEEELFDMCAGALASDGFLQPGDVKRLMLVRDAAAYPIYRKDHVRHLRRVARFFDDGDRLWNLGRTGEFRYMDIDKCVSRAFDLADEILETMGVAPKRRKREYAEKRLDPGMAVRRRTGHSAVQGLHARKRDGAAARNAAERLHR